MSSNKPTQNHVNNDTRGVKIFEADEVEFYYQAGSSIPTGATVKGQPDVVNFIAKTTDPDITISVSQGDGGADVASAQYVYQQSRADGRGVNVVMKSRPL